MVNDTIIIVLIKKWRVFGMVDYLFHEFAEDYLAFKKKKKLGDYYKMQIAFNFLFSSSFLWKNFLGCIYKFLWV